MSTYPDVESDRVDGVVVTVESLYALAGANVPHRNGFVTGARCEDLRVGLPDYGVDRVDVTAVGEP